MFWANQQNQYDGRSAGLDNLGDGLQPSVQKPSAVSQLSTIWILAVFQITIAGHYASNIFDSFCNIVFNKLT